MTVLVTGGAGYIGSITVRAIRASGRGVVVLDTLENGHRAAVGDAPFVQGDIADSPLVERLCREHGVDEVVHFAAHKAVGESMENPGKYFSNNVAGSQRLLEALHRAGVERIVFSSTAAVYGTPDSVPVRESDPIRCESVYAETKVMISRTDVPWPVPTLQVTDPPPRGGRSRVWRAPRHHDPRLSLRLSGRCRGLERWSARGAPA
ncbi:MAG: NAD-dependent epimerase/dehydratase family protein, partial [Actinomycetota bacterium]